MWGGEGEAVGAPAGTSPTKETTGSRAGGLMLPVLEESASFTVKLHPVRGDERDLYADGDTGKGQVGALVKDIRKVNTIPTCGRTVSGNWFMLKTNANANRSHSTQVRLSWTTVDTGQGLWWEILKENGGPPYPVQC